MLSTASGGFADLDLQLDLGLSEIVSTIKDSPRELQDSSLYKSASDNCARSNHNPASIGCRTQHAYDQSIARLREAAIDHPACASAAYVMAPFYKLNDPPADVAEAYDLGCFGAFAMRPGDPAPDEPAAPVMAPDLLSAVGVVLVDGVPQCSGLLTPAGRFVTARHCADAISANPQVVQSSTGKEWPLMRVASGSSSRAADDWAVYDLVGVDRIAATKVTTVSLRGGLSQEITLAAAWPLVSMPVTKGTSLHDVMRYPRQGLCEFINEHNGCLMITCQTIKGFSGAPVFRIDPVDGQPAFVGLVQGANSTASRCGLELLNDTTVAVSASQVKGDY